MKEKKNENDKKGNPHNLYWEFICLLCLRIN